MTVWLAVSLVGLVGCFFAGSPFAGWSKLDTGDAEMLLLMMRKKYYKRNKLESGMNGVQHLPTPLLTLFLFFLVFPPNVLKARRVWIIYFLAMNFNNIFFRFPIFSTSQLERGVSQAKAQTTNLQCLVTFSGMSRLKLQIQRRMKLLMSMPATTTLPCHHDIK